MARKRKDINLVSEADLQAYIHAIRKLRERSQANPDDPAGYDFQADLHNNPAVGPCEHGSDRFLPWHRAHLHYFEKALQASDPPLTAEVTIPYWDWIHAEADGSKFPARFSLEGLAEERSQEALPLPPDTLTIVGEGNQQQFAGYPRGSSAGNYGRLEAGPHNYMHPDYIGGLMASSSTAAQDPIYWSFHCFIDLLWDQWQQRNGHPASTSPDTNLRGFLNQPLHKIRDFDSVVALGSEYDYNEKLKEAFASLPQPLAGEAGLARSLEPLFSDRFESLVATRSLQWKLPRTLELPRRRMICLRDIPIPATGSYTLLVYLHPASVLLRDSTPEIRGKYFAGYATMWQAHGGPGHSHDNAHHHGHEPLHVPFATLRFEVTELLNNIASVSADDLRLTIIYRPSPDAKGKPQQSLETMRELRLEDAQLEEWN